MLDQGAMWNIIARQFAEGVSNFPPDIQQALQNTEVLILREEKQIRIVSRSMTGNEEDARKVNRGLGNALIPFLARVIGGFKCRVKYQQ